MLEPPLLPVAEGIARVGQPAEARQRQQPVGEGLEPVCGDAKQLQTVTVSETLGQGAQAVAREHQLLEISAPTQLIGQLLDGVVSQNEPAQSGGQGGGRDGSNAVGLEAHHGERGAAPQHFG